MLPEPSTFDGFVAGLDSNAARIAFTQDFDARLAALRERSGRARALAALGFWEETQDIARVALALDVKRIRAYQLIADGRAWRLDDADQARRAQEETNGAA